MEASSAGRASGMRWRIAYLMVIYDKGLTQIQSYELALSGLGMALTFTRIHDGDQGRTTKGRLVKMANWAAV